MFGPVRVLDMQCNACRLLPDSQQAVHSRLCQQGAEDARQHRCVHY